MSATETRPRVRSGAKAPATGAESTSKRRSRLRRRAPRLRVVRTPARRRRRWALVLVSSIVVGVLLVAIVATQALVSQTSFHMRDLQARAKALRQVNSQLTLQVANLSAPDRIVEKARTLGMGLPDSAAVQVLRPASNTPPGGSSSGRRARGGASASYGQAGGTP